MQRNILTKTFNCWIHPCILVNQEDQRRRRLYKRAGMDNVSTGSIFVSIPLDHFVPTLAENDLEINRGVCLRIVDTSLNCRIKNRWCFQVVMKMMRTTENGNSTEEMGKRSKWQQAIK